MNTETKKKRAPKNKDSSPIMRQTVRSDVLEKKIVDVYVPPTPCWNPISVKQAIDQHDRGQMQASGRLADTITRDSRIQACLETLVLGILGLPFEWKWDMPEEGDEGKITESAYKPTEEDLRYLEIIKRWFADFRSTAILSSVLTNVIQIGFAGMSKNWIKHEDYKGSGISMYIPECWVFHPSNIWYNTGTYEYNVTSFSNGLLIVSDNNEDERFQIIKHTNQERPWLKGIVRAVALYYMDKMYALNDRRVYQTNNANPLRILTTIREQSAPMTDTSVEDTILNIARHQQLGYPVHLPEGFKLELLEPKSNVDNASFEKAIDNANKEITIAYLGQNLTTDVTSGSHAAAKVHENVLHDRIEAYTKTINLAINTIVKEIYKFNFPSEVRVPIAFYDADPPENRKVIKEEAKIQVDTLKVLSDIKASGLLSDEELVELKKRYLAR